MTDSRQSRWQARKKAEGLCIICGKGALFTSIKCRECHKKHTKRQRKETGYKPWKRGSSGRPPVYV